MTDKELIKQWAQRRMKTCEEAFNICPSTAFGSRIDSYKALLSFIDSLPEEPASEDLEEEIERFAYSLPHSADGFWPKDIDPKSVEARTKYGVYHYWSYEQVMNIARHFALQNQWISVEEALPKYEKRVLVAHQYGCQVASLYKDNSHQYWGVTKGAPIGADITHWAEIPSLEGGEE